MEPSGKGSIQKLAAAWLQKSKTLFERLRLAAIARLGENGDLKILALFLAVILFAAIRPNASGHTRTVNVDIGIEPLNPYSTVIDWEPKHIPVTFVGTQRDIEALSEKKLRFTLRAKNNPEDQEHPFKTLSYDIKKDGILTGKGGARVRSIDSNEAITVSFDYSAKLDITDLVYSPEVRGLPPNMELDGSPTLLNAQVFALGAQSRLEMIRHDGIRFPSEAIVFKRGSNPNVVTQEVALAKPPKGIEKFEPSSVRFELRFRLKDQDSGSSPTNSVKETVIPTAIERESSLPSQETTGIAGIFSSSDKPRDAEPLHTVVEKPGLETVPIVSDETSQPAQDNATDDSSSGASAPSSGDDSSATSGNDAESGGEG